MTDDPKGPARSSWRTRLVAVLVATLALAVGGSWWVGRPKRTAEHFIARLAQGQVADAAAILSAPSSLKSVPEGVEVQAADLSIATVTDGELPLVALVASDWAHREGVGDFLAGRYRFQVGTAGRSVQDGTKGPTEVHCVAEGDRVVITSVRPSVD